MSAKRRYERYERFDVEQAAIDEKLSNTAAIIPLGSCFEAWLIQAKALPADPFDGITGLTNEGIPANGEFPKGYQQ